MKNIKLLSLFTLLSFGAFFLSNCTGTEEEPDPKPVVNFLGGSAYLSEDATFAANTPFTVGITASHTENIVSFKVVQSLDGTPSVELVDSADFRTKNFTYDFEGTTGTEAGTEIYEFIVADKDGNSTTKTITITNIGDGGADLSVLEEDNNGDPFRVWNFAGPNAGAYEIGVGSLTSGESNSQKDIQDSISADEIQEQTWPARWTSRNGTTFKKAADNAWSTITNERGIEEAWNAAGEAQASVEVEDGASYILKLKGGDKYALVTITAVEETTGNNLDYVQFIYKYMQ